MAQRINFEGLDERRETSNKGNSLDYYKNIPKWNKVYYEPGDYKEILKYLESGNPNVRKLNFTNAIYIGEVEYDRINGVGMIEMKDGIQTNKYIGCWKSGQRMGYGLCIWEIIGDRYEGNWINNTRVGQGVYNWANGDKYEGSFKNNEMFNGFKTNANGTKYEIKNGKEVGLGCFISTSVFISLGKGDNCQELNILRKYRDSWLSKTEKGLEMIEEYYKIAPIIVNKIDNENNSYDIYLNIYNNYLLKCIDFVIKKDNELALAVYKSMVYELKTRYLTDINERL